MKLIELINTLEDDTMFIITNKHGQRISCEHECESQSRVISISPIINDYDEPTLLIKIDEE